MYVSDLLSSFNLKTVTYNCGCIAGLTDLITDSNEFYNTKSSQPLEHKFSECEFPSLDFISIKRNCDLLYGFEFPLKIQRIELNIVNGFFSKRVNLEETITPNNTYQYYFKEPLPMSLVDFTGVSVKLKIEYVTNLLKSKNALVRIPVLIHKSFLNHETKNVLYSQNRNNSILWRADDNHTFNISLGIINRVNCISEVNNVK